MARNMVSRDETPDEFTRLHGLFVRHFGCAVGLIWIASALAAYQAPWTRNIRGLIDPAGRVESTWSFLFALPAVMTFGLVIVVLGGETLRRASLVRNQGVEFGVAGLAVFAIFCLAVQRVAIALSLAA